MSRVSEVTTVFSQAQFDAFAQMSGDDNPIHVDPEFSARTKFGSTVAHGMMLLAFLNAATTRLLGQDAVFSAQELSFRAPTPAGEPVAVRVSIDDGRVRQDIVKSDAGEAATGWVTIEPGYAMPPIEADDATYKGIAPGQSATTMRAFTTGDLAGYLALTDDPSRRFRDGVVPEALLGGMISYLLGVKLPGPGTNWLRQRFVFEREVRVGDVVEATVTVARVRPDKGLIDLTEECSVEGTLVLAGQSLVWASDVEPR